MNQMSSNRPRTSSRIVDFSIILIFIFFATFTVLGVAGFLPSDLQASLNPNPLMSNDSVNKVLSVFDKAQLASAQASTTSADKGSAGAAGGDDTANQDLAPIHYTPAGMKEYPVHITIPAIGVDADVINPVSTSEAALDEALKSGAVRYPTSGALNSNQDIFLFGHSSYLAIVHNHAYRTFNGLQNLKKGDEIRIDGADNSYVYVVTNVSQVKDSAVAVKLGTDHTLTLSTCDVFGAKEDRFVVTATFSHSFPLANQVNNNQISFNHN